MLGRGRVRCPPVDLPSDTASLREHLHAWYQRHGRRLAFRGTTDPWAVLVSEVMLQQTQAARIEPAWLDFMAAFPTPSVLADAPVGAALRSWSGLGYNRRAVSLQRAARELVERHAGRVPSEPEELMRLPGVGPYTARAVAAIAFRVPVAAVDTNVRRVVGRVTGGWGRLGDEASPVSDADIQAAADALVDPVHPDAWTHATMDLGALICRPRSPRCGACPLEAGCAYARRSRARAAPGAAVTAVTARPAPDSPSPSRVAALPFPRTMRWLRGRIVRSLSAVPEGDWIRVHGPIGEHPDEAVGAALIALEREGIVERAPDGRVRLPSSPA